MRLPIFALLFAAALALTVIVLKLGTQSTNRGQTAPLLFALSALGVLLWALVSMTAFEVTTVSGGTEFSYSYPSLAGVGAIGAAINLFAMVKAAASSIEFGGMST